MRTSITKIALRQSRSRIKQWLLARLAQKLSDVGVDQSHVNLSDFVDKILDSKGERVIIGDGPDHIELEFTKQDADDLATLTDKIVEAIPRAVEGASKASARHLFKKLKAKWPERSFYETAVNSAFQDRLEQRWGRSFELLRMLRSISIDIGEDTLKRIQRSKSNRLIHKQDVLIRLHARACQTLGEVIVLISNGYADGAIARWRTLHEIAVITSLIGEGPDELSKRYLDHEAVEAKRAFDLFWKLRRASTGELPPIRESARINRQYEIALTEYGKSFGGEYGWASVYLGLSNPRFGDLESRVDRTPLQSMYKMASYNVHAGVKGISYRLGLRGELGLLPGASNAGFQEPADNAAYAMVEVNFALLGLRRMNIELAVQMRILLLIARAIRREFSAATRVLDIEERERLSEP